MELAKNEVLLKDLVYLTRTKRKFLVLKKEEVNSIIITNKRVVLKNVFNNYLSKKEIAIKDINAISFSEEKRFKNPFILVIIFLLITFLSLISLYFIFFADDDLESMMIINILGVILILGLFVLSIFKTKRYFSVKKNLNKENINRARFQRVEKHKFSLIIYYNTSMYYSKLIGPFGNSKINLFSKTVIYDGALLEIRETLSELLN